MTYRTDLREYGYTIIRKLVPPELIPMGDGHLRILRNEFAKSVTDYTGYLRTLAMQPDMLRIFTCEKLLSRLNTVALRKPVLCDLPVLHVMHEKLRIPDGYFGVAAHQDWVSTQGSLDSVTVWVALTNSWNYPLEVIPGSHLQGLLPSVRDGSVMRVECDDKLFKSLDNLDAGDGVIFSQFLVHRTGMKAGFGKKLRISVSARFNNMMDDSFASRGYPNAQTRSFREDCPYQPTSEEVKRIYAMD